MIHQSFTHPNLYLQNLAKTRLPVKFKKYLGDNMVSMSILKYMRPLKEKPDLPDQTGPLSEKVHSKGIAEASIKIIEALEEVQEKKICQSRGSYVSLTPGQKYKFGKEAAEHDVTVTIRYYGKQI